MSDYIRRDDAKAFLIKKLNESSKYEAYECGLDDAISYIDEIPAADVRENVRGQWNPDHMCYECSICGSTFDLLQSEGNMNFCPNCGADMRGEDHA